MFQQSSQKPKSRAHEIGLPSENFKNTKRYIVENNEPKNPKIIILPNFRKRFLKHLLTDTLLACIKTMSYRYTWPFSIQTLNFGKISKNIFFVQKSIISKKEC